MKVLDPGHIYLLRELGSTNYQKLVFIKRSGETIKHDEEWGGVQTQEVLRALIDRTKYLNGLIPCKETEDAVEHLRRALFLYEARAYRRKTQKLNRSDRLHDDEDNSFKDVPFTHDEIEFRPIGEDGHIVIFSVRSTK